MHCNLAHCNRAWHTGKRSVDKRGASVSRSSISLIKQKLEHLVGRVKQMRVVRAYLRYAEHQGPILASGLAFGLLFAFFAGVWTIFSILGIIFSQNEEIQRGVLQALARAVPGLVDGSSVKGVSGNGVLSLQLLSNISTTLTITGLITLSMFVWKVTGWLSSFRDAVRSFLDEADQELDAVRSKLKDAAAVFIVILLFIASAVVTVLSSGALHMLASLLGLENSWFSSLLFEVMGIAISWAVNAGLVFVLFSFVSQFTHKKAIFVTTILGATVLSAMQIAGTRLVGGASSNPLLAPFAALLGILIWFNLITQVLLILGSYIAECTEEFREMISKEHHQAAAREGLSVSQETSHY